MTAASRYLTADGGHVPASAAVTMGGIRCRCMIDNRLAYQAFKRDWDGAGEFVSETWGRIAVDYPHRSNVVFELKQQD